ncbi:P-loop containing nucleoside triphosphate hydrolase protein [Phaeosphaeriaceae sp. PMI808]|nr:P-loop containing nucleoside triphosphate hydrolase protein [Phaeosphaeriaceae sp. PMI808]
MTFKCASNEDTDHAEIDTEIGVKDDTQNDAESSLPDFSDTSSKAIEVAAPGSIKEIKNIYKSPKDADGNWTWVEKYPKDVAKAAESDETAKFAIIAHSIIVQSPWLKRALGEHILKDYPSITCKLSRVKWVELMKFRKGKDIDEITKAHTTLLHDFLKHEISDTIKAFEDYILNAVITFDHLWMIFQPGATVVSKSKDTLAAFELERSEYNESHLGKFLQLKCECVGWSGKHFGRRKENICVLEFHGTEKIQKLHAFPLGFHENREAVKAELIERGKKFESLAGYQYKAKRNRNISDKGKAEDTIIKTGQCSKQMVRIKLTPYYQMLCKSRVRRYSLKLKKWVDFFVDLVSDITWNTNAFDSLVLPKNQKELILGFSESQVENRQAFDDVIQGKGKGVIMLLSGPLSVGKTLTAEAVAESMQVPLHTISSGDLGSSPREVEIRLLNILELVARWNAILLLDECDVFLEARSTHDLERNKIVATFFRTLEYCEGILFMATNRVDNIDTAFQSRIHVSMVYPELTCTSHLFRKYLDELASVELNGRQIKNILKVANLLACRKKMALNKEIVETVLATEKRRPERQDYKTACRPSPGLAMEEGMLTSMANLVSTHWNQGQ